MTKLEELKAAYAASTPGEWVSKDDHAPNMAAVGTGVTGWLGLAQMFGDTQKEANANAQFITLAHNNMAALLEAVERLEAMQRVIGELASMNPFLRDVFDTNKAVLEKLK